MFLYRIGGLAATAVAAAAAGGCAYLPSADGFFSAITPYRVEIVQGNVVTREQLARIKPGSSKLQVRDALGTPMLVDPFHTDRWDYVFTIRRRGTEPQRISVVLQFKGDVLDTVDAPELPTENEFVASISRTDPPKVLRALAISDEQRRALPSPLPPTPATAEAFRPEREYPALEAGQVVIDLPGKPPPAAAPAPASEPAPAPAAEPAPAPAPAPASEPAPKSP